MIIYKCEYCNKSFDRKQNLTRHYERKNKCYDINKFRVVEMKHNNATPNDTTTQKDTQTDTQNDTTTQKDTQKDTQIQPVSDLIIANNKPIKMSELHDSIKYLTKLSNNGKNKSSKIIKFSKTERDRKILRRLKPTKNITETKRIYRKSIKLKKNI